MQITKEEYGNGSSNNVGITLISSDDEEGGGRSGVGNNNYTEFNLIPIALQVGDERFLKDFKSSSKYKLSASVHSCPKYITGFGQKVIMLSSLDEPTSEIRHHTVIACFPLKRFPIPDLSSSRSYSFNESQSQKPKQQQSSLYQKIVDNNSSGNNSNIGNVENENTLSRRQGLSITLFENFMINEKIDKDLLLMICWINMPLLNDVDGSNTGLYIVRFEEEDIKLLKSLCDLANLLSFVNKNKNISVKAVGDKTLLWQSINCHLFHGIFSPNHIMDVCTQNQDVMMVATTKETL
ncbi:17479_t:CDS:2, partial [Entrophospora sp. SA101]